ncbi:MAG: 7TM diverse intracellular signaling domain-containing protein [Bdellovibrionota bacterium]
MDIGIENSNYSYKESLRTDSPDGYPNHKISFRRSSTATIFVIGNARLGAVLPFNIANHSSAVTLRKFDKVVYFGFLSALISLVIYNFFLYLGTRTRSYLLYVAYTSSCAALCFILGHGAPFLLSEITSARSYFLISTLLDTFNNSSGIFASAFAVYFLINLLDIEMKSQKIYSFMNGLAQKGMVLGSVTSAISLLTGEVQIFSLLTKVYGLIAVQSVLIVSAYIGYRYRDATSKLFFLTFLPVNLGISLYIFHLEGLLEISIWTRNSEVIGFVFEGIFLSYIAGTKVRKLEQQTTLNLLLANTELEKRVIERTIEYRSMLDNIPIGVFSLSNGETLQIDPERSKGLSLILPMRPGEDLNLLDFLLNPSQLNSDEISQIRSILLCSIGEDPISFESNLSKLPAELVVKVESREKILEVDWSVNLSADSNSIKKILVSCKDVTSFREYQSLSRELESKLVMIGELLEVDAHKYTETLQSVEALLRSIDDTKSINRSLVRMQLHTIKGEARNLGLGSLALEIHQYEAALAERSDSYPPCDAIFKVLDKYKTLYENSLGRSFTKEKLLVVSETTAREAILANDLENISRLIMKPASNFFADLTSVRAASKLALKHGKAIEFLIDDEGPHYVDIQHSAFFDSIFTHIIANSIDHGIEPCDLRLAKGKSKTGVISVKIFNCSLLVSDDGNGLEIEKLRAKLALNRDATNNVVANRIFDEDISSKKLPIIGEDQLSGRGVGLASVKHEIEAMGGKITLIVSEDLKDDVPFSFLIEVPHLIRKDLRSTSSLISSWRI